MLLSIRRIKGHSMMPKLHPGDVIIATSLPYLFSRPTVGDVVTFKYDSKIMVKRIIKIAKGKYFIKGDNVNDSKSFDPITRMEIVGKVILKI